MSIKLSDNTTHIHAENGINTLATTPEVYDGNEVFPTIVYLSFIQQLRMNTDITSHELGKKAVDYLEDNLHNTLSNAEKNFDHHTKLLLTSTTTRAHERGSNIYNIIMASISKVMPEMVNCTFSARMRLDLIRRIRIDTDIASHKLGRESLDYLDGVFRSELLDIEKAMLSYGY